MDRKVLGEELASAMNVSPAVSMRGMYQEMRGMYQE
jgi:hypothetical protein